MVSFTERVRGAWNAFLDAPKNEPDVYSRVPGGIENYTSYMSTSIPNRTRLRPGNERTIISSIYTRMSIDISSVAIRHTRHDEEDRYLEDVKSGLNDCLRVEANLDQGASAFRQDIVLTIFDKGVAAIVPVDTTVDPKVSGSYDIKTMRVGHILQWFPNHIKVSLYNERVGARQEILIEKRQAAIVENPLYSVMNETNSTLQRLIRKLSLLDSVDEAASSGKLDLIIQLPYVIKTEARKAQAEDRRKDIEFQLKGSQYGIAYTDGTEKITQLNRPAENNLLAQITVLINQLYAELGITPEVMNGTANEATMLNYNNRTVEPVLRAITEAMERTFLTKTARTQGQAIDYFRDPFKLVPMSDLAEMTDKFTRNEVFTSNEMRQFMGVKPSKDPKADQLINSNMPQGDTGVAVPGNGDPTATDTPVDTTSTEPTDTAPLDGVDTAIQDAFRSLGLPAPPGSALPTPVGLGSLDPSVVSSSLDDVDAEIDRIFSGLEG